MPGSGRVAGLPLPAIESEKLWVGRDEFASSVVKRAAYKEMVRMGRRGRIRKREITKGTEWGCLMIPIHFV